MAVSRHLRFLKFESCTIRSADPENPTGIRHHVSILYTTGVMLVNTEEKWRTSAICSRSSKVIDFGANRKPIRNFLLAINSKFGRISYRFRDKPTDAQS